MCKGLEKYFFKEYMQLSNMHTKAHSTSLFLREMWSQNHTGTPFHILWIL